MAQPTCPPHWDCTFVENPPKHIGPWWELAWGWVAVVVAVVALAVLLGHLFSLWHNRVLGKRELQNAREKRAWEVQMAEQTTMQLDMAKDDPAALEFVRRSAKRNS